MYNEMMYALCKLLNIEIHTQSIIVNRLHKRMLVNEVDDHGGKILT